MYPEKSPFLQSIWIWRFTEDAGLILVHRNDIKSEHLITVSQEGSGALSEEQRRTKYDIYADIIEMIARKGLCSLTRVSYGANMPVDRTKKVLAFLADHGFVREVAVGEARKYRATKWGLEYLETFKRMRKFFAALEEQPEQ
jgi:predicted transcriptional regulator